MMQRVVVIGAGGTVGKEFCSFIGCEPQVSLYPWNRRDLPLTNFSAVRDELVTLRPDYVFNFAIASDGSTSDSQTINVELPEFLTLLSKSLDFRLIQTSSVMVFQDGQEGPHTVDTLPLACGGYGLEKRRMEERVAAADGNAIVVRLGWQIGSDSGSNNMVDYLDKLAARGKIKASVRWFPSCSALSDTTRILWGMRDFAPGLYQLNTNEGDSFFEIVQRLKMTLNRAHWKIEKSFDFAGNQIMVDRRVPRGLSVKDRQM